jgi:hypothetical protein
MFKNSIDLMDLYLKNITLNNICVDATCGNGHDTLKLSYVFNKVFAFDIQNIAINKTIEKLEENNRENVIVINDSHVNINKHIQGKIDFVVFNLGYLPNSSKNIFTIPGDVIKSFELFEELLSINSLILLVLYPGFENGKHERDELIKYFTNLDQNIFSVIHHRFINQRNFPPEIIVINKIK